MKNVYTDHAEEYRALRGDFGLIDHDGAALITVAGPGAAGYLGTVTTRSVDFLLEGQSVTALLLSEEGSVLAEVLVHCRAEGYLIQVWPAQAAIARAHLLTEAANHPGATVTDVSDELAVLALEGPSSFSVAGGYLDFPISSMAYRTHATTTWNGAPMLLSRSGVTGEYGYALIVPSDRAEALRTELIAAGATTCGLDAVDTCRMEMRFVNIEREGVAGATPFHLGLQWMVDFSGSFTGRDRLLARWESGLDRILVCWTADEGDGADATPPQGGLSIVVDGTTVGAVAHAVYSPALGRVIGTARVDPAVAASGLEFTAGDQTVHTVSAPFLVATSFGRKID
ncbi:MAG: glycine cleavage T C-terminal barrel domain-containing protein [Pseudonocardiaceae bacterium]